MQKVFALLVADFRKLGATIVFASFSKVIIDTGKSDLLAAKAYCDSLLKTLQTRLVGLRLLHSHSKLMLAICLFLYLSWISMYRDLFEWIEFEPLQFWHSFLFMDQVAPNSGSCPRLSS